MPYGGSVWVVPVFPASSIRGPAKLGSILPLPLLEGQVPTLRSPLLPSFQTSSSLTSTTRSLTVGSRPPQVSLPSGGSPANWVIKDDPAAQLSAKLGSSDRGQMKCRQLGRVTCWNSASPDPGVGAGIGHLDGAEERQLGNSPRDPRGLRRPSIPCRPPHVLALVQLKSKLPDPLCPSDQKRAAQQQSWGSPEPAIPKGPI